jgi:hypothetical protein
MAGTAPTDFHSTKRFDAEPVHCRVWLSTSAGRPRDDYLREELQAILAAVLEELQHLAERETKALPIPKHGNGRKALTPRRNLRIDFGRVSEGEPMPSLRLGLQADYFAHVRATAQNELQQRVTLGRVLPHPFQVIINRGKTFDAVVTDRVTHWPAGGRVAGIGEKHARQVAQCSITELWL